jgi:uncharacterized lipoprotein NlpE involved in copper resistance
MKALMIIAISSIFSFAACAQKLKESQVPSATRSAFQKQYPGTAAKWEKEAGNYEVNFKHGGKTMSAVIDKNGTIVETETDIAVTELPQSAREYVRQHYKGSTIKEAAQIVKQNGEVNYEAEVKGKDVIFDANGKFLKEAKD